MNQDPINSTFHPKLLDALKTYNLKTFSKDVVSGIIVAIIALPLSIALALASGVGPNEGLYTAIIAGFIISALGGCSVQIAGPTAAFATMVAGIVARGGMSALVASTVMAGIFLIIFAVLKLGRYIKYIPYPITVGFTGGIAVTILVGQFKDFFGISYSQRPIETIEKIEYFINYFDTLNTSAIILGLFSLLIITFWSKLGKLGKTVPSSLVAIVLGTILMKVLRLNIKTIGSLYNIKSQLFVLSIPDVKMFTNFTVIKDAFSIAVLAGIESLLSAVVADKITGDKHYPNTELFAQGVGNIASALLGGIPATGAIARTAANIKNGGLTPVAGIVHSVVLFFILAVFVPYTSLIPMPIIAAILFGVSYAMCGWRNFLSIIKDKTDEQKWLINVIELFLTFLLTICFDLIVAICVGLVFHIIVNWGLKYVKIGKK